MSDRSSVVPQLLGAAVGIVIGSALLFALLGMLRGDDPSPEVAAAPSPSTAAEGTAASPAAEVSEEPTPEETEGEEPTEPTEAEETQAEPEPEPSFEPVEPNTVSIQVLDATAGDGTAAEAVAQELRDGGYDVVVVNKAGRTYDETTVFWSPEQDDGGRQVAAAIDAGRAEPTPEEVQLSDSVDVHVVVGTDRT